MKKVLFVASLTIHINTFHIPYLKYFKDSGYEVHVASNGDENIEYCDKHFNMEFERSPFRAGNIKAYKNLKKLIEEEKYDIIECNTPVASIITRLATKKSRKNGTRVIYMAHGFHFFKGAPIKNWCIYYPIEKYFSKYTDDLITINEEDYEIATKKLKAKKVYHIHGIGIDETKFGGNNLSLEDRDRTRKELGLEKNDFALFYVGELNNNKNQIMIIGAMKDLVKANENYKLLLAGEGILKEYLIEKIHEYGLENNVFLLGYRKDIPKLLNAVDLYIAPSKREGLPVNLLEAKLSNLPIIVTNARGQRELICDNENGYIVEIGDIQVLKNKIEVLYNDMGLRNKFIQNSKKGIEKYYLRNVIEEVKSIYSE